ncbi:MAG: peptidylprolyl isomerase [Gemmatimonadaceae bacterium]
MKSLQTLLVVGTIFSVAVAAANPPAIAASVGSQKLSVTRLTDIVGNSQVTLDKQVVRQVSELWTNYQLVALAAARNEILASDREIDDALWAQIAASRVRKFGELLGSELSSRQSSCNDECAYNRGDVLAASHILILIPEVSGGSASPDLLAAAKRKAEAIQKEATPQNFAKLAAKTEEPGGAERGGSLGVFSKGEMVPAFEAALLQLKPGTVSQVVQTSFGFHIIYRPTFDEVRDESSSQLAQLHKPAAIAEYITNLEKNSNVTLVNNAVALTRTLVQSPLAHKNDSTVIVRFEKKGLTAARIADWVDAFDPQVQMRVRLQVLPDSDVVTFLRQMAHNELLLERADSAHIKMDAMELAELRKETRKNLQDVWRQIGILPATLGAAAGREGVAATRVESYFDKLVRNKETIININYAVTRALRSKYHTTLVAEDAVNEVMKRATLVRAIADSLHTRADTVKKPKAAPPS